MGSAQGGQGIGGFPLEQVHLPCEHGIFNTERLPQPRAEGRLRRRRQSAAAVFLLQSHQGERLGRQPCGKVAVGVLVNEGDVAGMVVCRAVAAAAGTEA